MHPRPGGYTLVTVRWSRYGVDAGFRPKLVEARNLGLLSQRFLRASVSRQSANASLRRQFERLDGQLRLLARDYRTLAETLRELWR